MSVGELAPALFRRLNGVFCVHKPAGVGLGRLRFNIRHKLATELSALPWSERRIVRFDQECGVPTSDQECGVSPVNQECGVETVSSVVDVAHSPLVLGPRYQIGDIHVSTAHPLSPFSSGVQLVGVGAAARYIKYISSARMIRVYHVTCELGRATRDFTPNTRTLIKTTYRHVTREKVNRQLSAIQATHQRLMFRYAGVDPSSEEGYRLASGGPVRPLAASPPLIYNIRCTEFNPPLFTMEIHCVNEVCDFLLELVDLIGRDLKSSATCRRIQRIRVGHFGLDYALLQKHWTAQNIIENIDMCRPLVDNDVITPSHHLQPKLTNHRPETSDVID